jgi:hypothetical protein
MTNKKYLDDLNEIKNLMNRSSRFLSLSGLSGILAGVYALIGAFIARNLLNKQPVIRADYSAAVAPLMFQLMIIALVVLVATLVTAFLLTRQKAIKNNEKIWDVTTKKLLISFLIPLVTGGVFGLNLLNQGFYGLVAPITLIFYGLSLINASKYTLDTVKYLGYSEIIVGLAATAYIGFGLYFWAVGFGLLHIIYGSFMHLKERRD